MSKQETFNLIHSQIVRQKVYENFFQLKSQQDGRNIPQTLPHIDMLTSHSRYRFVDCSSIMWLSYSTTFLKCCVGFCRLRWPSESREPVVLKRLLVVISMRRHVHKVMETVTENCLVECKILTKLALYYEDQSVPKEHSPHYYWNQARWIHVFVWMLPLKLRCDQQRKISSIC